MSVSQYVRFFFESMSQFGTDFQFKDSRFFSNVFQPKRQGLLPYILLHPPTPLHLQCTSLLIKASVYQHEMQITIFSLCVTLLLRIQQLHVIHYIIMVASLPNSLSSMGAYTVRLSPYTVQIIILKQHYVASFQKETILSFVSQSHHAHSVDYVI